MNPVFRSQFMMMELEKKFGVNSEKSQSKDGKTSEIEWRTELNDTEPKKNIAKNLHIKTISENLLLLCAVVIDFS